MTILLSPGGTTTQHVAKPSNKMLVGTVAGAIFLECDASDIAVATAVRTS